MHKADMSGANKIVRIRHYNRKRAQNILNNLDN